MKLKENILSCFSDIDAHKQGSIVFIVAN